MPSVRQRNPTKQQTNIEDDQDSKQAKSRNTRFAVWKRMTFLLVALLLVIAFVNWPAPPLSRHARHWRDSGYLFNYNGKNIFYQDIVRLKEPVVTSPVLLIIHGYPTSGYDWRHLVPALQFRFARILIPDMLGLGFSDKPQGHAYSTMEQTTILEELLASLNVTDVHVLAHDYGDTITQELLARRDDPAIKHHPFKIKSICLTNGGILPSSYQPLLIQQLMILPVLNVIAGRISNWFLFKNRMSAIFGPRTQPSHEDMRDMWAITRHKEGNIVLPRIMEYLVERKQNELRWVSALQRTTLPLHLIYGPHDPINSPERFLVDYKELMKNSGVSVMENVGHYPQVEDPLGFMEFYNEFLDSQFLDHNGL